MDREFVDILKQIGCTDGLHVPVANEENRILQNEVEHKLRRKAELIVKLEIQDEQSVRMRKQIENLKAQKDQNQQLIVAHRKQHDAELSMLRESQASLDKTQQGIKDMNKNIQKTLDTQDKLQGEIKLSMKRLDQLKGLVEWGEEARHAWQEELAAAERDNNLLERFKLEDDAKFKEMELKRQRLKADVMEREAILNNELNMLTTLENQLEQVSRLFRRSHNERMSLISYWENAAKILHQRDNNIDATLQEIHQMKEAAREKFTVLEEERKFHETQVENNEELQRQLDELNTRVVRQRQVNLDHSQTTADLKSEVSTLRGVMSEMGLRQSEARSRTGQLSADLTSRQAKLAGLHKPITDLQERIRELYNADLSAAQRSKEIDDMLKVAERNNSVMQAKLDKLQAKVFEKTEELESLRESSKLMSGELQILQVNRQTYEKRAAEIEKEVINKENLLYDLDMQLVTLESKLARMQGERSDEEKMEYKVRILELEEALRKRKDVLGQVTAQFNKAKQEEVRLNGEVEQEGEQLGRLGERRQELLYLVDGGQKELTARQATNRQAQVALNLLRLQVDQRDKALAKTQSRVFGLERDKRELENALRERKVEIALQMDVMAGKKRTLEEEKSELKKALEHLNIRIEQIQKKHDIVMESLGKEEGGENFSMAYFKIKMAQERQELQEIGDELDSKIKKAENEIPAMENTLRVISASNDCYKRNLDSIDSNSPEMMEKKRLEEELEQERQNVRDQQAYLKDLTAQIHELQFSLSELGEQEDRVKAEWKERDLAARALDKELEEQQAKLTRADKQLRKLKREAHQMKENRIPIHLAEKDIELRELTDMNQSALQQLAELGVRYSETGPALGRYLGEKGLRLPMVRTSNCGSTAVSTHRSLLSEDSRLSWSSVPSSTCVASVVLLDPDTIPTNLPPARKGSGDSKQSRSTSGRKKSK